MPKLRNAGTDLGMLAQYLARKVKIHQPQAELDVTSKERGKLQRTYRSKADPAKTWVAMLNDRGQEEPNAFVFASANGRAFMVRVEEVNPDDIDKDALSAVGN